MVYPEVVTISSGPEVLNGTEGTRNGTSHVIGLTSTDVDGSFTSSVFYSIVEFPVFGSLWNPGSEDDGSLVDLIEQYDLPEVLQWVSYVPSVSSQYSDCGSDCYTVESCPPPPPPGSSNDTTKYCAYRGYNFFNIFF